MLACPKRFGRTEGACCGGGNDRRFDRSGETPAAGSLSGYFTTMDPFGDGDQGMRLTLKQLHLERAFDAVVTFWTPGRGLPLSSLQQCSLKPV